MSKTFGLSLSCIVSSNFTDLKEFEIYTAVHDYYKITITDANTQHAHLVNPQLVYAYLNDA